MSLANLTDKELESWRKTRQLCADGDLKVVKACEAEQKRRQQQKERKG